MKSDGEGGVGKWASGEWRVGRWRDGKVRRWKDAGHGAGYQGGLEDANQGQGLWMEERDVGITGTGA